MKGKKNESIREVEIDSIKSNIVDTIGGSMLLFRLKTTYLDPKTNSKNKGYGRFLQNNTSSSNSTNITLNNGTNTSTKKNVSNFTYPFEAYNFTNATMAKKRHDVVYK